MNRVRAAFAVALVCALIVGWSAAASAHVTIDPDSAEAGGFAILHFQVPNESDSANTVKIEIAMPQGVALPFVLAQPVAGWTVSVETSPLDTPIETDDGTVTEAVSQVTFEGGKIAPGQFQLFDLEVGPLPDEVGTTLTFPAVQTYDDGEEVRWVDPSEAGQPEPEHPAPTLQLVSASGGEDTESSDDSSSNALAIVGIAVGAVGIALGATALVQLRRRQSA